LGRERGPNVLLFSLSRKLVSSPIVDEPRSAGGD
jgi:hypothetical protein